MDAPKLEPRASGWEAQTLPLSYNAQNPLIRIGWQKTVFRTKVAVPWLTIAQKATDLDPFGRDFASLLSIEDAIFDLGADLQLFGLAVEVAEVEEDLLLVGQRLDEAEAEKWNKCWRKAGQNKSKINVSVRLLSYLNGFD